LPALTRPGLRGVWGTLLLPLNGDDSIDFGRLRNQADFLAASGLHGLYAHGTAGEFHTLTEAEFDTVNELLADACKSAGVAFQIGCSHPLAQTTLERVRRAASVDPGAVQVILPDWLPLSDDEVIAFLSRVADVADPVPVVLYNPPHAKTQVYPELLGRLSAQIPALIGLKSAGGDDAWFVAVRAAAPGLSVFVPGHLLASGIARGAHGSYSNIAALSPSGAVRWYELMQRDLEASLELERRIGMFFAAHIAPLQAAGLSNPALDKFLAAVGDWADVGTRVRWPMTSAPAAAVAAARPAARTMLPELFPV
jgi:dihydrodipicolinate synthase/N-acetylneuraminate lyase